MELFDYLRNGSESGYKFNNEVSESDRANLKAAISYEFVVPHNGSKNNYRLTEKGRAVIGIYKTLEAYKSSLGEERKIDRKLKTSTISNNIWSISISALALVLAGGTYIDSKFIQTDTKTEYINIALDLSKRIDSLKNVIIIANGSVKPDTVVESTYNNIGDIDSIVKFNQK